MDAELPMRVGVNLKRGKRQASLPFHQVLHSGVRGPVHLMGAPHRNGSPVFRHVGHSAPSVHACACIGEMSQYPLMNVPAILQIPFPAPVNLLLVVVQGPRS